MIFIVFFWLESRLSYLDIRLFTIARVISSSIDGFRISRTEPNKPKKIAKQTTTNITLYKFLKTLATQMSIFKWRTTRVFNMRYLFFGKEINTMDLSVYHYYFLNNLILCHLY